MANVTSFAAIPASLQSFSRRRESMGFVLSPTLKKGARGDLNLGVQATFPMLRSTLLSTFNASNRCKIVSSVCCRDSPIQLLHCPAVTAMPIR